MYSDLVNRICPYIVRDHLCTIMSSISVCVSSERHEIRAHIICVTGYLSMFYCIVPMVCGWLGASDEVYRGSR